MTRLILQIGTNIEARTSMGYTPFLSAVHNGDINTILLLGFDANTQAKTEDGSTALHIAVVNGNQAALEFLLNKGDIDVNSCTYDDMRVGIPLSLYLLLVFNFLDPFAHVALDAAS